MCDWDIHYTIKPLIKHLLSVKAREVSTMGMGEDVFVCIYVYGIISHILMVTPTPSR